MDTSIRELLAKRYGGRYVDKYVEKKRRSEGQYPTFDAAFAADILTEIAQFAYECWCANRLGYKEIRHFGWQARWSCAAVKACGIDLDKYPALKDAIAKLGESFDLEFEPTFSEPPITKQYLLTTIRGLSPETANLSDAETVTVFAEKSSAQWSEFQSAASASIDFCREMLEFHLKTIEELGLDLQSYPELRHAIENLEEILAPASVENDDFNDFETA